MEYICAPQLILNLIIGKHNTVNHRQISSSLEALPLGAEAVLAGHASVVGAADRLVARVAGQLHLVVLHNILLHDRGAIATLQLRLLHSLLVKIALRDVARVPRKVGGHLSGALSQVVSRMRLLLRVVGQFVAGVATVGPVTNIELTLVEAAVRGVSLSGQAPHRWAALDVLSASVGLNLGLVGRLKVTGRATHRLFADFSEAGGAFAGCLLVVSALRVSKEMRLVREIVVD